MWLIVSLAGIFIRGYLYHSSLPLNQLFLLGVILKREFVMSHLKSESRFNKNLTASKIIQMLEYTYSLPFRKDEKQRRKILNAFLILYEFIKDIYSYIW